METRVWIEKLRFNDGNEFHFDANDIVVVVGANNCGKSTLLLEMLNVASQKPWLKNARMLTDFELKNSGSVENLVSDLKARAFKTTLDSLGDIFQGYKFKTYESSAKIHWREFNSLGLGQLLEFFLKRILADTRLNMAASTASIDTLTEVPIHPIHFLYEHEDVEAIFNDAFRRAFDLDLIVNKGSGKTIHLHVGERPELQPGESVISRRYLEELKKLPVIEHQGDGMRSFVGLLLETLLGLETIILIDEPEIFLHPPQARLLGRMIAKDVHEEKQIFISTHSEDFLKGLLDSNSSRIKILRIDRVGNINHVTELSKEQLKSAWNDPFLRHSNVLSGLFHKKVVVCEGDSDCRFYSAILEALFELQNGDEQSEGSIKAAPDILFVQCGGKDKMPIVIEALRRLNVPVCAVCDFDVLNDEEPLRGIYEALGGDWGAIEKDWKLIKSEVDSKRPELDTMRVKEGIAGVLKDVTTTFFPQDRAKQISEILRRISAWAIAKDVGKNFIPSGAASQAFDRLQNVLAKQMLMIVKDGQIESFDRSLGNHGSRWVNEVLRKDLRKAPELDKAREFVMKMV
jgi:predicted ATPase